MDKNDRAVLDVPNRMNCIKKDLEHPDITPVDRDFFRELLGDAEGNSVVFVKLAFQIDGIQDVLGVLGDGYISQYNNVSKG